MAAGKVFETLFKITGKYTAGPAFAKTQKDLTKTATVAKKADKQVKGMFASMTKALIAYNLGAKALAAFTASLRKSISAAEEVQESHDALALSLERNVKHYAELRGKTEKEIQRLINADVKSIIARSEALEKTGHDAETVQSGIAKLIDTLAMAPKQAENAMSAFEDVLSFTAGANATAEESAELGEQWSKTILSGNIALAKRLRLTDSEIAEIKEVNRARREDEISQEEAIKRRTAITLKWAAKFKGETQRVFDKPSGKVQRMWIAIGNIYETLGEPFIKRAESMAESFEEIAIAIKPIAERLAEITDVHLKNLAAWLKEHKTEIPTWLESLWTILNKIREVLQIIEDFEFGALTRLLNMIAGKQGPPTLSIPTNWPLPQLPGNPKSQPVPAAEQNWDYAPGIGKIPRGTPYTPAIRQDITTAGLNAQTKAAEDATKAAAAATGAGAGATEAGTVQELLKNARAQVVKELEADPALKELLMKSAMAEVGNQDADTQQKYMESVINRLASDQMYPRKGDFKTIREKLLTAHESDKRGYYPQKTINRINAMRLSSSEKERLAKMQTEVFAGSNKANFATGNESFGVRSGGAPILSKGSGEERFVGELWTLKWIEDMRRKAAALKKKGTAPAQKKDWFATEEEEKRRGGKGPAAAAPSETIRRAIPVDKSLTNMIKGPASANTDPFAKQIQRLPQMQGKRLPQATPQNYTPITPYPGQPGLQGTTSQLEDAMMKDPRRQGLNRMIRGMNTQQAVSGASGGTNVASWSPSVTINGVDTAKAKAVASAVKSSIRESSKEFLDMARKARDDERRTTYV